MDRLSWRLPFLPMRSATTTWPCGCTGLQIQARGLLAGRGEDGWLTADQMRGSRESHQGGGCEEDRIVGLHHRGCINGRVQTPRNLALRASPSGPSSVASSLTSAMARGWSAHCRDTALHLKLALRRLRTSFWTAFDWLAAKEKNMALQAQSLSPVGPLVGTLQRSCWTIRK